MIRVYADLGNSRLKLGRPDDAGGLEVISLPSDGPDAWLSAWDRWNPASEPSTWSVSTANPRAADRLAAFLDEAAGVSEVRWFRSAADVPVRHRLENPETAGADRALAVVGALARRRGPGLVVSCGSAVTVERVGADGVWDGGAIGPGLRMAAEALHALSTRLPLVRPDRAPSPWGRSTVPALEAGVFWGTVGLVRALVGGQADGLDPRPWVVWTGGDAPLLLEATALPFPDISAAPALVLDGLRAVEGG